MASDELSKFADILRTALLTVTSFRTLNSCWNSITSIRFVHIMLLDAHLTSHPRMSGSRWVTAWLWLFRSLRSLFAQFFSVILLPLLYLFCSVRSYSFLTLIMPVLAWSVPSIFPIFLKTHLVLPILLFSSIYLHCSFKKAFFSPLAVLWNSAFSWVYLSLSPLPFASLPQLFVKPPQTTTLPFCISFSVGWFWSLPPVQC